MGRSYRIATEFCEAGANVLRLKGRGFLGPAFFLTQLSHINSPAMAVLCMACSQGIDAFSQSGLFKPSSRYAPRYSSARRRLWNGDRMATSCNMMWNRLSNIGKLAGISPAIVEVVDVGRLGHPLSLSERQKGILESRVGVFRITFKEQRRNSQGEASMNVLGNDVFKVQSEFICFGNMISGIFSPPGDEDH
ncbi:unnamed protein product [Prunus armeniaca]|uniref:Uncharacterized protein n=1 Tax=Prunus armeniaca TaxID=36596 RepID=A0A6J5VPK7_PRUAR|nr:unnamed protein product [Prunus armeniaca]